MKRGGVARKWWRGTEAARRETREGGRERKRKEHAPPYPPSKISGGTLSSASVFVAPLPLLELCILPTKNKDRGIK